MNQVHKNSDKDNKQKYKENYCDVVMKGGITSGVVYPKAIAELAKYYRLKNIGGTSAGALAACVAAAAEYRRGDGDDDEGYAEVERLAKELSHVPPGFPRKKISALFGLFQPPEKKSTLFGLFQPSEKTAPLFKILEGTLNKGNRKKRLAGAINAAFKVYIGLAAGCFLAGSAFGIILLAFAQSLSSCAGLSAFEIGILAFAALLLFGLAHRFAWFDLKKDWKTKFTLSAIVLAAATYFLQPVSCTVALLPALALGIFLATVGVGYNLYRRVIDIVSDDDLGFALCTGMPPANNSAVAKEYEGYEALTPWLHEKIQKAANLPMDKPLTFGDLWDAKGFPPAWMAPALTEKSGPELKKSINLQLITTNLTHGRPYILPFDQKDTKVFFKLNELKPFFPESILKVFESTQLCKPARGDASIRELPPPQHLPVLFAARLSLSFPGLLSAIPLYMIDDELDSKEKPKLERCWFSDGGISSNFPIHFFDGFLPVWPTFGFMLGETRKHKPHDYVDMPSSNKEGKEIWNRFNDKKSFERLMGFHTAILNAARNWNDNTLAGMPGVRERVVHIYLDPKKEGGLNLNMEEATIDKLVGRGAEAAQEIIERYINCRPTEKGVKMDFDNHAWIRLNTFVDMISARMPELARALSAAQPVINYRNLINNADRLPPEQYPLNAADIQSLANFIQSLSQLSQPIISNLDRPLPKGALRARPPL